MPVNGVISHPAATAHPLPDPPPSRGREGWGSRVTLRTHFQVRHLACLGFTLIEVLVALAILTIALTVVMHSMGQAIDLTANLRDRQVALWVAQNRLTLHQLQHDFPSTDSTEGTVEMGGREWRWREQVAATPEPALRRIEIDVRAGAEPALLAHLVGFLERTPTP